MSEKIIKKQTIRIEENENKEIKKYLIDLNLSFQEYVMRLIREDMKNNAKGGKD